MSISAVVDDAGLTPTEFRVLAHICRRAGEGECWAGGQSIAASCRINLKTARRVVTDLSKKGWVSVQKRAGQTSVLKPTFPVNGTESTAPNPIPCPNGYPTQSDTLHPTQLDTQGSTQLDTPEGHPIRTPNKDTQRVVLAMPFPSTAFAECWTMWLDHRKSLKKRSTPQSQKMALNKLAKMTEQDAIDAIRYSVEKNWQSIYPPKPTASTVRSTNEQFAFQKNGQQFRPFD